MNTPYVETECTVEHNGRKFESGGAVVTPERIIAYPGKPIGDGMGCDKFGPTSRRELCDWHGNVIGTCVFASSWPVRSYLGSRMYQIYATVNGVTYTGRGTGEGMAFSGKRCKA